MPPPCQKPLAFTLIELLVTVAIIALLIAILVPNLARARQRTRNTICSANLRTLGIAINLYAGEFSNNLPRIYTNSTGPADPGRLWWFGFEPNGPGSGTNRPLITSRSPLAPYTANLSTHIQCPEFPYDDPLFFQKFNTRAASYGYNMQIASPTAWQSTSLQRYSNRLSTVAAFADGLHFDFGTTFNEAHYLQYSTGATTASGYAHFRHPTSSASPLTNGTAQIVFLDSHVNSQTLTGPTYRIINNAPTGNLTAPDGSNSIYGF